MDSSISPYSLPFTKLTYDNAKPYLHYNKCEICERKHNLNECNICKELYCQKCDVNLILNGNCYFCEKYYQ